MKNFWSKLKISARGGQAIFALAPMAGVTDSTFRQICKDFGADVVYSEMVSAAGLAYGSKKTLELMKFSKKERPFVVQLFGAKPEHFAAAARIVEKEIKPDGLDINFGCPVKKVARQGAGAVLMNDLKLARRVVAAAIGATKLPVSVKIRSQVGETDATKFLHALRGLDIKAVMIHGRTLSQGHTGEVDWKIIKRARPLVKGVLLANGGIKDRAGALELLKLTGADGVGVGQAALGRPWVFKELRRKKLEVRSEKFVFKIIIKHAALAEKLKGRQGIMEARKHLCWYVSGLAGAGELRRELVRVQSLEDVKKILKSK